jgi:hypothetical protein
MSKYTTWDEHTFKYFKSQMERHFGDRPHIYNCLIQLAIFDKIIQDMKRNFKDMQQIRTNIQLERMSLNRIKGD